MIKGSSRVQALPAIPCLCALVTEQPSYATQLETLFRGYYSHAQKQFVTAAPDSMSFPPLPPFIFPWYQYLLSTMFVRCE
jgi:hypothetical protein